MKINAVLLVFLYAAFVSAEYSAEEDQLYDSTYDDIDIEQILRNETLIKSYHECFMDRGDCTPQGTLIKKNLPEALRTECARCTEKQIELAGKVFNFLLEEKPELFDELEPKYDPDQIYRKKKAELIRF